MKKFLVFVLIIVADIALSQGSIPEPYKITSVVDFTENPTGSATGIPDIKIPLYQIATLGDLIIDLTLQYNLKGGTNTTMIGNQFGDSWNLTFLGTISRACPLRNPIAGQNYVVDDQRFFSQSGNSDVQGNDKYTFNVLGLEGRFTLSKVNNQIVPTLVENNNFVSIQVDYDSTAPRFNSFTIKDKKGMSYIFEEAGDLDSNKYHYAVPNTNPGNSIHSPNFDPDKDPDDFITMENYGPAYQKSWYLTKIVDRYGKTLASIEYEKVFILPDLNIVSFIKRINIINKGVAEFENHIGQNNKKLINSYTKNIIIKDIKENVVKNFEFTYTKRSLSMNNGSNVFSKLFLEKIKQFNTGKTKSEDYSIQYKSSAIGSSEATLDSEGSLKAKNYFGTYQKFKDIATYMSLQKITYPTGGATLYQFEPNTHSNTFYQQSNKFNTDVLFINTTFDYATSRHVFNVPLGYEKMYIAVFSPNNTCSLYHENQILKNLYHSANKKFEDLCIGNTHFLNLFQLNGLSGNFYIHGPAGATLNIMITKLKEETAMEKFEYSGGLRIKRIAHFSTNVAGNYLEYNPIATNAEREIVFDYSVNANPKESSGKKQFINDPMNFSSEWKLLYEKVTVTNRGISKSENYFNNVDLTDPYWYNKNMLPKSSTTYDNNSTILQNTIYNRQYTTVGVQPVITQEQISKKEYEQGGYLETDIVSNYDAIYRNLIDTVLEDHLGKTTKSEFDYTTINNTVVNTHVRNYINGSLTEQSQNSYDTAGNPVKTEFKTPNMSAYEVVGAVNKYDTHGNLIHSITPEI